MTEDILAAFRDGLNRVAKADVDLGDAPDFETAIGRLKGHRVAVAVGPEAQTSAAHQAAVMTAVNITRRFALGGVEVRGPLDAPLRVASPGSSSLGAEVERLGGRPAAGLGDGVPTIVVGTVARPPERAVTVTFDGWRGGVVPASGERLAEAETATPAPILGAAIAAAEAFAMLRGEAEPGRRALGLSLWRPDGGCDWREAASDGPPVQALPDDLWILGLGHLGQAFLWTLALLPFTDPGKVRLTLQDDDVVTGSTDSTSIMTQPAMVGSKKTRALAAVLEAYGFQTRLVERRFDGEFVRGSAGDPAILVCGVDNALARSRIEKPGFPFVVEAGIGGGAQDFRSLRVHTFPSSGRAACELWGRQPAGRSAAAAGPAYRSLADLHGNGCGLALLAETAVGAPFVGTVAASLMVAQILRLLAADVPDGLVDLDLRAFGSRRALVNGSRLDVYPSFQAAGAPSAAAA